MDTTKIIPLAQKFEAMLKKELGNEAFAEMLVRNINETNKYICHSHDFCDANIIMEQAFKEVMERPCLVVKEPNGEEERKIQDADFALWNAAWFEFKEGLKHGNQTFGDIAS